MAGGRGCKLKKKGENTLTLCQLITATNTKLLMRFLRLLDKYLINLQNTTNPTNIYLYKVNNKSQI